MCREGSSAYQQRGHKVGGEKSWFIARATLTPSSSTARIQHLRREAGTTAPRQHVRLSSVSRFVKWRLLLSWRGQCATRWRWMCWQRLSTLNLEARHNATARQRCLDAVGGSDGRSCCWAMCFMANSQQVSTRGRPWRLRQYSGKLLPLVWDH